ncbi:hypothetical protein I79_023758 [Cricetulus griseus]|uniref:Uncharacterized protein n=1 Tax=Cricetulus griseus TaxID=10029 RepID=G3IIT3_CRIGR|nr:hypothetical protein I79_023758 [Cricetulus griseus]
MVEELIPGMPTLHAQLQKWYMPLIPAPQAEARRSLSSKHTWSSKGFQDSQGCYTEKPCLGKIKVAYSPYKSSVQSGLPAWLP